MKFPSASPFESLSHIGHYGHGGPLNLSRQTEILRERTLPGNLVDRPCQSASFLPSDQILEPLDLTHPSVSLLTQSSVLITQHFQQELRRMLRPPARQMIGVA